MGNIRSVGSHIKTRGLGIWSQWGPSGAYRMSIRDQRGQQRHHKEPIGFHWLPILGPRGSYRVGHSSCFILIHPHVFLRNFSIQIYSIKFTFYASKYDNQLTHGQKSALSEDVFKQERIAFHIGEICMTYITVMALMTWFTGFTWLTWFTWFVWLIRFT